MHSDVAIRVRREESKERSLPIAVIIPVFKHSSLFIEALTSVQAASAGRQVQIVIVDDGCPHSQTLLAGILSVSNSVHYLRQKNRGLSGARNRGIDFVLEHLPECEALYFLDADNRLSSFSVERFVDLLEAQPDTDWFYPDINMIGIAWAGDYSGPFRYLTQALMNICEAGSLVRRRVFEGGSRFDEQMLDGYEDWEFWLSLMEQGFRGSHMPASGFLYRKRAESMLADSIRRHTEIINYIEKKHPWMQDVSTLVSLEHYEAPRFAVICSDTCTVLLGSDPTSMRELALHEYIDLLHSSFERPNWVSAGSIVVFSSRHVLSELRRSKLLISSFWRSERELIDSNFVALSVRNAKDGFYAQSRADYLENIDAIFLSMPLLRAVLMDTGDSWISQIVESPQSIGCAGLAIRSPLLQEPSEYLRAQGRELYAFAKRQRMRKLPSLWSLRSATKHEGTPDVTLLPSRLRERFNRGTLPCHLLDESALTVAFVLPIMDFGGVEKVALNVAREFKARGFKVDFVVWGNNRAYCHSALEEVCEQVYILDHIGQEFGGGVYEGTYLPTNVSAHSPELENLLRSYDAVVNCHAAGVLHTFANLRRAGVVTVNYLHLIEYSRLGQSTGHPVLGVAFEHSIDAFACCSGQMSAQIAALAVPREKIVEVPNGPGININCADSEIAVEARNSSLAGRKLRILYFGRLDAQKGLDRLSKIAAALRRDSHLFHLRIVGGKVVDANCDGSELPLDNEAPVYSDHEIAELFLWSDIIIMPSRFEGLPLSIIEAMMFGVVPIVTGVGAIAEVVEDGVNGYVVSNSDVEDMMIKIIRMLEQDRVALSSLSLKARESVRSRDWTVNTAPLINRVEEVIQQRRRKKGKSPYFRNIGREMLG